MLFEKSLMIDQPDQKRGEALEAGSSISTIVFGWSMSMVTILGITVGFLSSSHCHPAPNS
jgi:hypothetical protein